MTLPSNFSPAEHLQDLCRRTINQEVREWFKDLGTDQWDPDISVPRGSLRVACTHQENDTLPITVLRSILFYMVCKKAADLQQPIYGIPIGTYQELRKFKPQVMLYFLEDAADVDAEFAPVTAEVSFRLMNETEESLSMADLTTLGNKIKTAFATGSGFVWRKGKVQASYSDPPRGYHLRLLCRDEAEAKRVIEQVLDIQSHTPDWQFLNVSKNEQPTDAYPTLPDRKTILGKSRRMPRKRPIANVRFQYAVLNVWGIPNPICLVDRSGHFANPIVQ
jgi:hypothetical protein